MTRTAKLLLAPMFFLQLLFFGFVALHRFIDGDEGFYLMASRLVMMHKRPYLDFLYMQAPLLPYAYAFWMKCFGVSWTSGRLFSALLTAMVGVLVYEHVCRQTRSWLAGLSAVVLFSSTTLVFAWFPLVKTFSLAGLFLFAAYVVVSWLSAEASPWTMTAGGLLLGMSVVTRSYLLLLIPVFLWWIFRNFDPRTRLASIFWFLAGFGIAMLPCFYLFISSPDAFLFNNLGFHGLRSSRGLIGWWQQKLFVAVQLFMGSRESNGLQWSILFFVSLGFISSIPTRRYPPRLAFQIAIALSLISLLPTPVIPQYFSLCLPFLIVSAVCGVSELFTRLESKRERLVAAVACVCVSGIYLGVSAGDFRKYLITGDGVPSVRRIRDIDECRLQRIIEVSKAIDQIARPGEMVASFWPGYIFQTKATPVPGFENDFGLPNWDKLTAEQRARYHILSPTEIEAGFAAHRPRIVVLGKQNYLMTYAMGDAAESSLRANGYTSVRSIGSTSIYIYPSKP